MPAATPDWPDGSDYREIAMATRVVLLDAAARTCILGSCTRDERELLTRVHSATNPRFAQGMSFTDFLEAAKDKLVREASRDGLDVVTTLQDIGRCRPADPIGELFDRLVDLASEWYAEPLGRRLDPRLRRSVLEDDPHRCEPVVRGLVRQLGNEVALVVHLPGFDLRALTLVPRVLAHELVCHIAARHTGAWDDRPEPDVRTYFSEGFMDRAAWRLFTLWREARRLPTTLPLDQLSGDELDDTADREIVFPAGRRAFENCFAKTTEEMERRLSGAPITDPDLRRESELASIRAALRLNTCSSHIKCKDRFANFARGEERAKATDFGAVAAEDADPVSLLDDDEIGTAA